MILHSANGLTLPIHQLKSSHTLNLTPLLPTYQAGREAHKNRLPCALNHRHSNPSPRPNYDQT